MRTKTFQVNGAKVTIHTEDGNAYIDRMAAENALGIYAYHTEDDPDKGYVKGERKLSLRVALRYQQFATAYAQSEIDGDLGFSWPDSPLSAEEMIPACEAWLAQPAPIVAQWLNEISNINTAPNDPDLAPPDHVDPKD